jgi:predicted alpha/beta-fold hydrolase
MPAAPEIPPFRPHPLLRSGHLQTLAAVFLPGHKRSYCAVKHHIVLDDEDQLVLHEDAPADWKPGKRAVLLMHGLSGCYESGYMQRVAEKLSDRGFRSFRLDLRGCGAGAGLASHPYHSGRSADVAAVLEFLARHCPDSPVTAVGFSLSANVLLKLLGEIGDRPCANLDSAIALCPPVDLRECSLNLSRGVNRLYDVNFLNELWQGLRTRERLLEGDERHAANHANGHGEAIRTALSRRPLTLFHFDDVFTGPVSGFAGADDYYRTCSSGQFVPGIRLPTLVLASADDPLIPKKTLDRVAWPSAIQLHITDAGGHLGFISRRSNDPDNRWMDWRIIDWISALDA